MAAHQWTNTAEGAVCTTCDALVVQRNDLRTLPGAVCIAPGER